MNHHLENIESMNRCNRIDNGMDVIIISTSNRSQEIYWQKRLDAGRGQILAPNTLVLVVHEDWPGGAGNGLGTLYAFAKATQKSQQTHGIDLNSRLAAGAAIAIYHTAGKGTRLAPLPGSENNNKPGVKLPGLITIDNRQVPITILEAVIKQTSIYVSSRKGRISVFWGDQIFVPSLPTPYTPSHPVDILCRLIPMPDESQWQTLALEKYGILTVNDQGNATQVEKVSHATALRLNKNKVISIDHGIGISLGSFSISHDLLNALVSEFTAELDNKKVKLDSDPHFWMPMTLDLPTYTEIMRAKGENLEVATQHFQRMQRVKLRVLRTSASNEILGVVDIGNDSYWWDYGQIHLYRQNNLKLTFPDNPEAMAMAQFFRINSRQQDSRLGTEIKIDANSLVCSSRIESGSVKNSILIGVNARHVEVENAIIIQVTASSITGNKILLYNVVEQGNVALSDGQIRADVFIPFTQHIEMVSDWSRDGGKDWEIVLPRNTLSYDDIYKRNSAVDILVAETFATMEHNRQKLALFEKIW